MITTLLTELLQAEVWFCTGDVSPAGTRLLFSEGNGWNQAACAPAQAQDPGQRLNRGSFCFHTHNTMEVLSTKEKVFSPLKGLPSSEEAGEDVSDSLFLVDSSSCSERRHTQKGSLPLFF